MVGAVARIIGDDLPERTQVAGVSKTRWHLPKVRGRTSRGAGLAPFFSLSEMANGHSFPRVGREMTTIRHELLISTYPLPSTPPPAICCRSLLEVAKGVRRSGASTSPSCPKGSESEREMLEMGGEGGQLGDASLPAEAWER